MSFKQISKHIRLPEEIIKILEEEANGFGFKINDWIEYLLTNKAVSFQGEKSKADKIASEVRSRINLTPHHYPYVDRKKL